MTPPGYVIEAARSAAIRSPCAKSKRGAALYRDKSHVLGRGFNGQPSPFECSGNCGERCRMLCMHAEQRAIIQAIRCEVSGCSGADLVHVKVVDGVVVPGGGPSCWQCSRLVVEVGLRGVWLYQIDTAISYMLDSSPAGKWRFYAAEEFHRETLRACELEER